MRSGLGHGFLLLAFTGLAVTIAALVIEPSDRPAQAQTGEGRIAAIDAAQFIGLEKTVCGVVASATFAFSSNGQPTFINLDRPYPDHIFTAVVWGDRRGAFPQPPEDMFLDECVCVSGEVGEFGGRAQIVVDEADRITLIGHDSGPIHDAFCAAR